MKNYNVWYMMIAFFVIMIFIPPIFRFSFPKENTNVVEETANSRRDILSCNNEKDNVSIDSIYIDNRIDSLTFKFSALEKKENDEADPDLEQSESAITNNDYNISDDLFELSKIDGAILNDNSLIFKFNEKDFSEVERLQRHIRNINMQKMFYEEIGFSCKIVES